MLTMDCELLSTYPGCS